MSSWFGIPTINSRLDHLTVESAELVAHQDAFESHVRRKMDDATDDLRTSLEMELEALRNRVTSLESRIRDVDASSTD